EISAPLRATAARRLQGDASAKPTQWNLETSAARQCPKRAAQRKLVGAVWRSSTERPGSKNRRLQPDAEGGNRRILRRARTGASGALELLPEPWPRRFHHAHACFAESAQRA